MIKVKIITMYREDNYEKHINKFLGECAEKGYDVKGIQPQGDKFMVITYDDKGDRRSNNNDCGKVTVLDTFSESNNTNVEVKSINY